MVIYIIKRQVRGFNNYPSITNYNKK